MARPALSLLLLCAQPIAGGAPPPTSLRAVVQKLQLESLVSDVLAACDWITATAQVKGETLPPRTSPGAMAGAMHAYNYSDWQGGSCCQSESTWPPPPFTKPDRLRWW